MTESKNGHVPPQNSEARLYEALIRPSIIEGEVFVERYARQFAYQPVPALGQIDASYLRVLINCGWPFINNHITETIGHCAQLGQSIWKSAHKKGYKLFPDLDESLVVEIGLRVVKARANRDHKVEKIDMDDFSLISALGDEISERKPSMLDSIKASDPSLAGLDDDEIHIILAINALKNLGQKLVVRFSIQELSKLLLRLIYVGALSLADDKVCSYKQFLDRYDFDYSSAGGYLVRCMQLIQEGSSLEEIYNTVKGNSSIDKGMSSDRGGRPRKKPIV